ncbi:MAG: 1-acyl-sn-glycerol-3-phosphate acyltransferase, partial [Spirochaetia bacterium]|nr:1-acyl-sn-glycerol-3-phosphate acyltransferase [Spirochaetia bacterium]
FKIGGIPIDRENPILSKQQLLYSRKTLHDGKLLVLFPEQSRYPNSMGEGKSAGFRFIMGKPVDPVNVICVGIEYNNSFPRRIITIRFGEIKQFSKKDDPEDFLKNCMLDIARLSNLNYPF